MRSVNYLFLLFVVVAFLSCSDGSDQGEITISKDSYLDDYPAVYLDLSSGAFVNYKFEYEESKEIDADLWIEPQDPEIRGLTKFFKGIKYKGEDVLLKVLDEGETEKEAIALFPSEFNYYIPGEKIKSGLKFILRSSTKSFYMIKIIYFNKDKEEMKLEYQKLEEMGDYIEPLDLRMISPEKVVEAEAEETGGSDFRQNNQEESHSH